MRFAPTILAVLAAAALAADGARAAGPGGELAFVRGGDIHVLDLATRRVRPLVATPALEHSPAFSPDGTRLLFVRERGGRAELYVAAADGSGARRLTRGPGRDYEPSWSPDGRRIAFASDRGGSFAIWVAAVEGGGVRRVAPRRSGGGGSFSPAWSPDGRLIAFSSSAATPENPTSSARTGAA